MLQKCTPYELLYIRTVLTGTLQDHIESLSAQESSVNSIVSLIRVGGAEIIENIDKLVCTLALLHVDNKTLAEQIYKILDNREILGIAETLDDKETLDKLRLLYVLAVYHPAFSFSQHHHLLSVHLRHLDELYHAIEVEEHCKVRKLIIVLMRIWYACYVFVDIIILLCLLSMKLLKCFGVFILYIVLYQCG